MIRYFSVELVVTGPVLTKGTEPGDPGLDAVALRAPDGSLMISGKHLHGRCRHAAIELARLASNEGLQRWATEVFGPDAPENESDRDKPERSNPTWNPQRARIAFEDLRHTAATPIAPAERPRDFRLKKNDVTGAGDDRMLAVIERAGEHGAHLTFSGRVRVGFDSNGQLEMHRVNLLRSLRWLTNVGGLAGSGYGLIQTTSLRPCKTPDGYSGEVLSGSIPGSLDMVVTFQEPFCLAAPQMDENVFHSLDYISGNALAGAIMRALDEVDPEMKRYFTLRKHFNSIRFRHCLPANAESQERPIPIPQSWVCLNSGNSLQLFDAALAAGPSLFRVSSLNLIPNFLPDWKDPDYAQAAQHTGWTIVKKELRTYTAINPLTGTAADKKLYSYELVHPENVVWKGGIDIDSVPEDKRPQLLSELRSVLNDAPPLIGKTDARASLSLKACPDVEAPEPLHDDGEEDIWIVTLCTQALLLDSVGLQGASSNELATAYAAAWKEIAGGLLMLKRHFTQETLIGSNYLYHRFRGAVTPYFPYLITGEGSVFVLESPCEQQAQVQARFRALMKRGLPLRKWAVDQFARDGKPGDDWSNCPFIPQNGYGEIVVNHPRQVALLHTRLNVQPIPVNTVICNEP